MPCTLCLFRMRVCFAYAKWLVKYFRQNFLCRSEKQAEVEFLWHRLPNVSNLTFGYEGSYDTIFENAFAFNRHQLEAYLWKKLERERQRFSKHSWENTEYWGSDSPDRLFRLFSVSGEMKRSEWTQSSFDEDWKWSIEIGYSFLWIGKVDMD